LIVSFRLLLNLREVALAVLAKFAAFTTFTELSIVRMLDRRTNGRAVKQSLWQNIAFDEKEMSIMASFFQSCFVVLFLV